MDNLYDLICQHPSAGAVQGQHCQQACEPAWRLRQSPSPQLLMQVSSNHIVKRRGRSTPSVHLQNFEPSTKWAWQIIMQGSVKDVWLAKATASKCAYPTLALRSGVECSLLSTRVTQSSLQVQPNSTMLQCFPHQPTHTPPSKSIRYQSYSFPPVWRARLCLGLSSGCLASPGRPCRELVATRLSSIWLWALRCCLCCHRLRSSRALQLYVVAP